MKVHARKDQLTALAVALLGAPAIGGYTVLMLPLPAWMGITAGLGALVFGVVRFFHASRRLFIANRFQRVPSARVGPHK